MLGVHVSSLVPDDSSPDLEDLLEAALSTTSAAPRDTVWRCRDGSLLDVAMSVSPLKDPAGRMAGFSALLRNVTERKRRERQLAATAAVRSRFLSGAPIDDCLQLICDESCALVSARTSVLVLVGTPTTRIFDGTTIRETSADVTPAVGGLARQVLESAGPRIATGVLLTDAGGNGVAPGPVLGVPVVSSRGTDGVLMVARGPGEAEFADSDVDLLGSLADQSRPRDRARPGPRSATGRCAWATGSGSGASSTIS